NYYAGRDADAVLELELARRLEPGGMFVRRAAKRPRGNLPGARRVGAGGGGRRRRRPGAGAGAPARARGHVRAAVDQAAAEHPRGAALVGVGGGRDAGLRDPDGVAPAAEEGTGGGPRTPGEGADAEVRGPPGGGAGVLRPARLGPRVPRPEARG